MTVNLPVAGVARLRGDPTCAKILRALGDGRALPAGELAARAGIAPAPASACLASMTQAGLLICVRQGPHRYYRNASLRVADVLEVTTGVAPPYARSVHPRIDPALVRARTCYKHLAGRLGVALCDAMRAAGQIELEGDTARVTQQGLALLAKLGLDAAGFRKHPCSRICVVDWSERREHLAGLLGNGLHSRFLELDWVRRRPGSRTIGVTRKGASGFQSLFGIDVAVMLPITTQWHSSKPAGSIFTRSPPVVACITAA